MPAMLRANDKAHKLFKEVMSQYRDFPKDEFKKQRKIKQFEAVQNIPPSSSPNGIGPIF